MKEDIVIAIKDASPKIIEHNANIKPDEIAHLSETASNEIDSIFQMAEVFYKSMPDK